MIPKEVEKREFRKDGFHGILERLSDRYSLEVTYGQVTVVKAEVMPDGTIVETSGVQASQTEKWIQEALHGQEKRVQPGPA